MLLSAYIKTHSLLLIGQRQGCKYKVRSVVEYMGSKGILDFVPAEIAALAQASRRDVASPWNTDADS